LPARGTTLFTLSTTDGIVMAADDLMYTEQDSQVIPMATGISKVFAFDTVLIGGAGIILCEPLKYALQDWISDFIQAQRGAADKRPNAIAEALHAKMRETFQPIDAIVKQGKWKSHGPGEWLVGYVVAGYTKNFTKPYIYEIGTEVNADGNGLLYTPPTHRPDNDCASGKINSLCVLSTDRSLSVPCETLFGPASLGMSRTHFRICQMPCRMPLPL
jgi:hypothetical protein